jgi:hypothetical protein
VRLNYFALYNTKELGAISVLSALKHRPCQPSLSLLKDFNSLDRILLYKSSSKKSLKHSKPSSNARGDILLFIITRIIIV